MNTWQYAVFRNVRTFGAKGDGIADDSDAINLAAVSKAPCDADCGNSFSRPNIIYFPPGTYKICKPIVQYYYSQFVGHATNRPTIKGCATYSGSALIETDPLVPDGNGAVWYKTRHQFLRQIRNIIFDLREMGDGNGNNVPTGINWQVAQSASLHNLDFLMETADGSRSHVGINTVNGAGGFASDLKFIGGNIGWHAGLKQYTARSISFSGCSIAVQVEWDWGFNFHGVCDHSP